MYTEAERIIERVAQSEHTDVTAVRAEMEKAVSAAYESADPEHKKAWKRLFPNSVKAPSVEEFITVLGAEVMSQMLRGG